MPWRSQRKLLHRGPWPTRKHRHVGVSVRPSSPSSINEDRLVRMSAAGSDPGAHTFQAEHDRGVKRPWPGRLGAGGVGRDTDDSGRTVVSQHREVVGQGGVEAINEAPRRDNTGPSPRQRRPARSAAGLTKTSTAWPGTPPVSVKHRPRPAACRLLLPSRTPRSRARSGRRGKRDGEITHGGVESGAGSQVRGDGDPVA